MLRLWCYGGPHVIKVEIKRTKMIFFLPSFQSGFQLEQFDYTCTAKVCLEEIDHVHHIGVTSHLLMSNFG